MTIKEARQQVGRFVAETFIEEDTDGDRLCCTIFLASDENYCGSLALVEDLEVVENCRTGVEKQVPQRTIEQIRKWAESLGY